MRNGSAFVITMLFLSSCASSRHVSQVEKQRDVAAVIDSSNPGDDINKKCLSQKSISVKTCLQHEIDGEAVRHWDRPYKQEKPSR